MEDLTLCNDKASEAKKITVVQKIGAIKNRIKRKCLTFINFYAIGRGIWRLLRIHLMLYQINLIFR